MKKSGSSLARWS